MSFTAHLLSGFPGDNLLTDVANRYQSWYNGGMTNTKTIHIPTQLAQAAAEAIAAKVRNKTITPDEVEDLHSGEGLTYGGEDDGNGWVKGATAVWFTDQGSIYAFHNGNGDNNDDGEAEVTI